jgi:hypothetical protein
MATHAALLQATVRAGLGFNKIPTTLQRSWLNLVMTASATAGRTNAAGDHHAPDHHERHRQSPHRGLAPASRL